MTSSNDTRITVSRRSVAQVAPYESEEATTTIEFSVDAGTSKEEILDTAKEWRNELTMLSFRGCRKAFPGITKVLPWQPPRRRLRPQRQRIARVIFGET
mgnify:CR=1 FL=1